MLRRIGTARLRLCRDDLGQRVVVDSFVTADRRLWRPLLLVWILRDPRLASRTPGGVLKELHAARWRLCRGDHGV
jgi:hypothetical protein